MQTITWTKRTIDGSATDVHFTRLFSAVGGDQEARTKLSLEIIARRQGLIRSQQQFMDEMSKFDKEHKLALSLAMTPDEAVGASEYFGTQAMLATVRYGLSDPDSSTIRCAIKRFEQFLNDIYLRSSASLIRRAC